MCEYGEKRQRIITFHSTFRVTAEDYGRWGAYARGAPEYGPDQWRQAVKQRQFIEHYGSGARKMIDDRNQAAAIAEFLKKRNDRVMSWTNGGDA